jgi:hypothetical protein
MANVKKKKNGWCKKKKKKNLLKNNILFLWLIFQTYFLSIYLFQSKKKILIYKISLLLKK